MRILPERGVATQTILEFHETAGEEKREAM